MASVISDQTEVSYAETTTGWTGDTFIQDLDIKSQGNASNSTTQTNSGANTVTYAGTWDMTGQHLRVSMNSSIVAPYGLPIASNGVEVVVVSSGGTGRWTVAGSDTYAGGFIDFVLDMDGTATSGSITPATVTSVSITINTGTKPRNSVNGWYDNWRYGNGLTINSTAAEAVSFQDVADIDGLIANAYNMLTDTDGVLFARGKLTLGSATTLNCNLVSANETVYFVDANVSSTLYAIKTQIGTGTTDVNISGLTCKTVGLSAAELDFSVAITSLNISGSSFSNMGTMTLFSGASVLSSTFTSCVSFTLSGATFENHNINTCGLVTATSAGTVKNNTFNKSTSSVALSVPALTNVTGNTFISDGSNHAVDLGIVTSTQAMIWNNTDTGYAATNGSTGNETILVSVSTGITLTINVADGASTPTVNNTGLGTVLVIAGQKSFKFTINPALTGYEYRIYSVTAVGSLVGAIELQGLESATLDNYTYTYSYSVDTPIAVQILPHANDYEEAVAYYTLTNGNQDVTINLTSDINN